MVYIPKFADNFRTEDGRGPITNLMLPLITQEY